MIAILLALAATAQAAPVSERSQLEDCIAVVKEAPEKGLAAANDWMIRGGSLPSAAPGAPGIGSSCGPSAVPARRSLIAAPPTGPARSRRRPRPRR